MATSARISGNPIFVCVPAGSKAGTTKIDYNRGSGPLVKVGGRTSHQLNLGGTT
jgi:hypothetical protein